MTKLCICQICNCGRHKCKHRPNPGIYDQTGDDCKLTEYKTKFHSKPIPVRESFKPKENPMRSGDPLEDKTTNRQDYVPHDMERPYHRVQEPYRQPNGDFDFMSSYKKEYNEKRAPPAQAVRPNDNRQIPAEFQGEPTYKSDYKKWDAERVTPFGQTVAWRPPSEKFDGDTTVKRDYQPHRIDVRASMRPKEQNRMSSAAFDDQTGYRRDYVPHELQAKQMREQAMFKPPSQPVESTTTNKQDFRGAPGYRGESFKPAGQAIQSDSPFDDHTTFRSDYQKWPTNRVSQRKPDAYQRPDGDIESNTTYKQTYVPQQCAPAVAKRPVSSNKMSGAPFDGQTNYNRDYLKWNPDRAYAKPRDAYTPMKAPFEGQSTSKAHYVPHAHQLPRSFKPDGGAYQSDAPFDDSTNYKIDYTKKNNDPCPAMLLETDRAGYKYLGVTSGGHTQYAPLTPLTRGHSSNKLAPLQVN